MELNWGDEVFLASESLKLGTKMPARRRRVQRECCVVRLKWKRKKK